MKGIPFNKGKPPLTLYHLPPQAKAPLTSHLLFFIFHLNLIFFANFSKESNPNTCTFLKIQSLNNQSPSPQSSLIHPLNTPQPERTKNEPITKDKRTLNEG